MTDLLLMALCGWVGYELGYLAGLKRARKFDEDFFGIGDK